MYKSDMTVECVLSQAEKELHLIKVTIEALILLGKLPQEFETQFIIELAELQANLETMQRQIDRP